MTDVPTEARAAEVVDESDEFVRVRFAGGRFDSHTIPFDVLPDLSAYRDLIVEVAKHIYRLQNPDRQRVPRGFVESFQLGLSQIIQGNSATALAKRIDEFDHLEDQQTLGFPKHMEFEEARNLIDRVIVSANENLPFPDDFPEELASRFNRFGQSLKAGEFTEISHNGVAAIRYDSATRKRIVLSANATYENALDQEFTITGGELISNVIHLMDDDRNRINLVANSSEECDHAIARRRHRLRVIGTGQFDRNDRLSKISTHTNLVYKEDAPHQTFDDRLNEIAGTPAGWYKQGNPAPNGDAVERMRNLARLAVADAGVPPPYIYPLPSGGIVAEWTRGDWEVSATIDVPDLGIELHALNVEDLKEVESEIAADEPQLLAAFGRFWGSMTNTEGEE
ncbi:MAG TPA: hypothetical protein PLN33_19560 [Hyphomonadaceae bacterium]|nr:hypothetical protein [Hyphomonadaceae bacterium]